MAEVSRHQEARRWMLQAGFDLKAAEWNLKGGFYNTVCFLAQQSAEKALKSVLYYKGVSRTKLITHSTVQLLSEGSSCLHAPESLMDDARDLDLHYIPSRYPNGLPGGFPHSFYGESTATSALQSARRIIEAVTDLYTSENFSLET